MRIKLVALVVALITAGAAFQLAPRAHAMTGPEQPLGAIPAPDMVSLDSDDAGINLQWSAVEGAETYNIYQDDAYLTTTRELTASVSNLNEAHYYVTACAGSGETTRCSSTSESRANGVAFVPETSDEADAPETSDEADVPQSGTDFSGITPTNLQGSAVLDICSNINTVTLTWDGPEAIEHYRVYQVRNDDSLIELRHLRTENKSVTFEEAMFGISKYQVHGVGPIIARPPNVEPFPVTGAAESNIVELDLDHYDAWPNPCSSNPDIQEYPGGYEG